MKVSVSNIADYLFCPRNLYLKEYMGLGGKLSGETAKDFILHRVRRELSLRGDIILERAGDSKKIGLELGSELDCIFGELPSMYRETLSGINYDFFVPAVRKEVSLDLKRISDRLTYIVEEAGFERALEKVRPWKKEYGVESENLGLTGLIDKIFRDDNVYSIADIKTVFPGEEVWETDKVSVCAYSMLLEERLAGKRLMHGFVEYAPVAETRPVTNSDALRKKVLGLRDEVAAALTGDLPDICPHGSGRRCESCSLMEECYRV